MSHFLRVHLHLTTMVRSNLRNAVKSVNQWQDPTLRLVPEAKDKFASVSDTTNSLGSHNTLIYGPRSLATETKSTGGLKDRLENVSQFVPCLYLNWSSWLQWEETQDMTKLTMLRNTFGMHAPMRLLMERKAVTSVCTFYLCSWAWYLCAWLDIYLPRHAPVESAPWHLDGSRRSHWTGGRLPWFVSV